MASSKITNFGLLSTIRAIASRCLCPPDNRMPLRPIWLSNPWSSLVITSCSWAMSNACHKTSSLN
ncbi:Protein of uncharacterised function (DUF1602) [Vibrio cholerae]|nr:Protein of uncharacterised function (DUF1602) [Vibrio cholerae]